MSTKAEPHRQPSSDPAAELASTRFERFLLRWMIDHGISGLLHGTIFVLGILLVLGAHPPSHLRIILLVALTAFAAALADGYSELTELQIRKFGFLDAVESAQVHERMGSVLISAVPPIVIFSLSRTGLFEVPTAFNLAQTACVALFGACGYLSRRVIGSGVVRGLFGALIGIIVGTAIVWLKALVH